MLGLIPRNGVSRKDKTTNIIYPDSLPSLLQTMYHQSWFAIFRSLFSQMRTEYVCECVSYDMVWRWLGWEWLAGWARLWLVSRQLAWLSCKNEERRLRVLWGGGNGYRFFSSPWVCSPLNHVCHPWNCNPRNLCSILVFSLCVCVSYVMLFRIWRCWKNLCGNKGEKKSEFRVGCVS